jgi:hypothetical protein
MHSAWIGLYCMLLIIMVVHPGNAKTSLKWSGRLDYQLAHYHFG